MTTTIRDVNAQFPVTVDSNTDNSGFQNPPPMAPTLPGNEQVPMAAPSSGAVLAFATGDAVGFASDGEASSVHGQTGKVIEVQGDKFVVRLASGLRIGPVDARSLTKLHALPRSSAETLQPQGTTNQSKFYAPFAQGGSESRVQAQAARLKSALEKSGALQATIPACKQLFWQAVKNEEDLYGLEQAVKTALVSHGYFGPGTQSPPRLDELKKQLSWRLWEDHLMVQEAVCFVWLKVTEWLTLSRWLGT